MGKRSRQQPVVVIHDDGTVYASQREGGPEHHDTPTLQRPLTAPSVAELRRLRAAITRGKARHG